MYLPNANAKNILYVFSTLDFENMRFVTVKAYEKSSNARFLCMYVCTWEVDTKYLT
jgi:hypothetical protein